MIRRRGADDPVTPELRAYILGRDRGCLIGILLWNGELELADVGPCRSDDGRTLGLLIAVAPELRGGLLTIAHVRDRKGGRMGKRPPSIPRRLVAVCHGHHLLDAIVDRRHVRPIVDAYLETAEGPELVTGRPWERIVRVRGAVDSTVSEPEGGHGESV
jgi:hypothetical protein